MALKFSRLHVLKDHVQGLDRDEKGVEVEAEVVSVRK